MKKIFFIRISPNFHFKNPHPQNIIIPFDIAQIISLLPKGQFQPLLIDTWVENLNTNLIVKRVIEEEPSFLAITTETPTIDTALEIFRKVKEKKPQIFTIAFGQHPSFLPKTFLFPNSPVSVCVIGESEETILELIKKPNLFSKISGLAFWGKKEKKVIMTKPRKLIENLDTLPFLAHDYFLKDDRYQALFPVNKPFSKIKWGFLLSSRGCPYRCRFCSPSIRNSFGNKFRSRSPKLVVDEIQFLVKNFKVNSIVFEDDVFSLELGRVKKICEEIIQRKISINFAIQTRADKLDSELLKKLKLAGCSSITLGVESGNEKILRATRKGVTKKQIKEIVFEVKKNGIGLKLNFIVGFPHETFSQAKETLDFAKELNPLFAHFHYLTPYPGTKIFKEKAFQKYSFKSFSHCNLGKINLSLIPQDQYPRLLRSFYKSYYFRIGYFISYLPYFLMAIIKNPYQTIKLGKEVFNFLFDN